ncbi:TetR/AcrR family transcriptional regulator C-terminal domain-containing protein [Methylobacterium goesingense]|uniref:AcrR family transcriptional regulator n=1 Tax=Methylobacterium goesingense TaxID=243690 RepID=A0ABV2LAT0_9HYPH|nr:TetR/AcrR family transcriptional regulator C-terminal domain-containing protein [Methylobacterium goesingense]GJD74043.1 hypothetical protein CFIICLFH_2276 [Methylobacterium goesingense]
MAIEEAHPPRRVGRPRRGTEGEATRRIIDAAIPIFLADGFEAASVDAIAAAAGASKKTVYTKFTSKADLFEASCLRFIETHMPRVEMEAALGGSTAECLYRIAHAVLTAAITPSCIALRRIAAAEAVRFPEFARTLHDFGHARISILIEQSLALGVKRGDIAVDDLRFAADYFVNVAIIPPLDRATFGIERPELTHIKRETLCRTIDTFLRAFQPGPAPIPGGTLHGLPERLTAR